MRSIERFIGRGRGGLVPRPSGSPGTRLGRGTGRLRENINYLKAYLSTGTAT